MNQQTTDDGWSSNYIRRRTSIVKNLTFEIDLILKEIKEGDFAPIDSEVMLGLAEAATKLSIGIESRFGKYRE